MKKTFVVLTTLFALQTANAGICNKPVIVANYSHSGALNYILSDDGVNPSQKCNFVANLRKEATDSDCARIALYQGYKCGQIINEVVPVYETDMSYSTYITNNACWACN